MHYHDHIVSHVKHPKLIKENALHVVGVCSNPVRYNSRYRLAREWIKQMLHTENVKLTIVEAAHGDRHHEIEQIYPEHTFDSFRVRTNSYAWIKESMINLAFRHIVSKHPHAKYFAWVDMDVFFKDPYWAQEAMHQLQHYEVMQPWSDALNLGPHGEILEHHKSFGWKFQRNKNPSCFDYKWAHTGYAWACTRSFIEKMWGAGGASGPLMDWAILGSADHHMARAMMGEVVKSINGQMHPAFFRKCLEWQMMALKACHRDIGFQKGRIEHMFHGPMNRRYYVERWQILVDNHYNPDENLTHDDQGLAIVVGNKKLEQAIHQYNMSRAEDSIDVDDDFSIFPKKNEKKSANFIETNVEVERGFVSEGPGHHHHGGGPVHEPPPYHPY